MRTIAESLLDIGHISQLLQALGGNSPLLVRLLTRYSEEIYRAVSADCLLDKQVGTGLEPNLYSVEFLTF